MESLDPKVPSQLMLDPIRHMGRFVASTHPLSSTMMTSDMPLWLQSPPVDWSGQPGPVGTKGERSAFLGSVPARVKRQIPRIGQLAGNEEKRFRQPAGLSVPTEKEVKLMPERFDWLVRKRGVSARDSFICWVGRKVLEEVYSGADPGRI